MLATKMNPRVFWGSSLVIGAMLALAIFAPGASDAVFGSAQTWVLDTFGWFYIAAVPLFLAFVVFVAISPTGAVKLGPDDGEPDFPYLSWLAMLFAAGMGIGLMYYAVAEPISHYALPPTGEGSTAESAREAMVITFMHWGVHAWAIYAVVGLSLAFFAHRKGLPLTLRSGLRPLLRSRTDGWMGDAVDMFAIVGTLFGIATSLGLGVAQINAGLDYLVGLPNLRLTQVVLIAVVMGLATISVLTGLDKGIRRLSELNLVIAVLLMLFVLTVGPTGFLLQAVVQNFGEYLDQFFERTFKLYAYEPNDWIAGWTLFYWAWWIAWSPFVGMFIARISRGRTVREFVIGVLMIPAGFSFLWMTVFGDTAIALDMGRASGQVAAAVQADLSTAIFRFFEYLPFAAVTSTLAVVLVAVFFVTSADSGSLVIDTIASGGADDTPRWQRIYWCGLEGLAAALLLLAGGLGALQAATLIAALPFAIIMFALMAGLWRGLNREVRAPLGAAAEPEIGERLKHILMPWRQTEVRSELEKAGKPALVEMQQALLEEGLHAELQVENDEVTLQASGAHGPKFTYRLEVGKKPLPAFSPLNAPTSRREHEWRLRATVGEPLGKPYDVTGLSRESLIDDVLDKLNRWRARTT